MDKLKSIEEWFKYHCKDEAAIDKFYEALDLLEVNEKKAKDVDRYIEQIEEQLGFARDLVSGILNELKGYRYTKSPTTKALVKWLHNAIEGNSFEL